MGALASRVLARDRGEVLGAALVAALGALLLVAVAPPAGDAPAHLYRTLLVQEGVHVWDNLWFGGQYPLASYSLLYYLPAALVGNEPLVVAAVVLSAALFASLLVNEWGEEGRWPARAFAVLAWGPLFTGTYSYALGLAALLGSLRALQAGRSWVAVGCAALTLGFSPLAFVFLCLVLLAIVIARGRIGRRALALGAGLGALAALEVAALLLFRSGGTYPFPALELAAVLTASTLGAALALGTRRGHALAAFFGLWGLASLAVFLLPTPFGENLARLRSLVFPLMLLTAILARFRPRWLAGVAVSFALGYNLVPYLVVLPQRVDVRSAAETYWTPAVRFLNERSTPDYRVEVVPTLDHWEAYWVPRAGFALARGWYRQLDIAQNPVFYREPLAAGAYRAWLRRMGVRYVLLPDVRLGPMGAEREANLLRSGRSGLVQRLQTKDWAIFELPGAAPILTGPGEARLSALRHQRIAGWTAAPGRYRLRVHYMPYWRVRAGGVCLSRTADGMTALQVRRPGRFLLELPEGPASLVRSAGRNRIC